MAANNPTDVLMFFKDANGLVEAECTSTFEANDFLMDGFKVGYFFEVDEWNFGMNLVASDTQGSTSAGTGAPGAKAGQHGATPTGKGGGGAGGQYAKFLDGTNNDAKTAFIVDMEPFEITRQIDKASPVLFQACCERNVFKQATMVKRKVSGEGKLQAFFRQDFFDVLLTGIDWDDGEVVKEKCKFVFRRFSVQYAAQTNVGNLNKVWNGNYARNTQTVSGR